MNDLAFGIVMGFLVFLAGMLLGAAFVYFGFKKGVTLMDNLYQEKAPFDDVPIDDEQIQSHTDGSIYKEETEG